MVGHHYKSALIHKIVMPFIVRLTGGQVGCGQQFSQPISADSHRAQAWMLALKELLKLSVHRLILSQQDEALHSISVFRQTHMHLTGQVKVLLTLVIASSQRRHQQTPARTLLAYVPRLSGIALNQRQLLYWLRGREQDSFIGGTGWHANASAIYHYGGHQWQSQNQHHMAAIKRPRRTASGAKWVSDCSVIILTFVIAGRATKRADCYWKIQTTRTMPTP